MKPDPEMIDDDNPEWTDAVFAEAVKLGELPRSLQAKLRGRPKSGDPKQVVTLRLRESLIQRYKAQGDNWRANMEAILVKALG
jgi:uncharacterized protein (DUF4415 family)